MKQSNHGTGDIIHRPFTAHAISQRLTLCDKIYAAFLQGIAADFGGGDNEAAEKKRFCPLSIHLYFLQETATFAQNYYTSPIRKNIHLLFFLG